MVHLELDDLLAIVSEVLGLEADALVPRWQKRIAVLGTLHFLNCNGFDLDLDPPEKTYETIVGVASGIVALDELTAWMADRMCELRNG